MLWEIGRSLIRAGGVSESGKGRVAAGNRTGAVRCRGELVRWVSSTTPVCSGKSESDITQTGVEGDPFGGNDRASE